MTLKAAGDSVGIMSTVTAVAGKVEASPALYDCICSNTLVGLVSKQHLRNKFYKQIFAFAFEELTNNMVQTHKYLIYH